MNVRLAPATPPHDRISYKCLAQRDTAVSRWDDPVEVNGAFISEGCEQTFGQPGILETSPGEHKGQLSDRTHGSTHDCGARRN